MVTGSDQDDFEFGARRLGRDRWTGDDFTRPTGPAREVRFLDRSAWQIELAPPPRKPHPMQLIVDQQTGLLLREGNAAFGTFTEWTSLDLAAELPDDCSSGATATTCSLRRLSRWAAVRMIPHSCENSCRRSCISRRGDHTIERFDEMHELAAGIGETRCHEIGHGNRANRTASQERASTSIGAARAEALRGGTPPRIGCRAEFQRRSQERLVTSAGATSRSSVATS